MKAQCTKGKNRRIARWEHEGILDVVKDRLDGAPFAMRVQRQTVEHVFRHAQGLDEIEPLPDQDAASSTHQMSLQVPAYNLKGAIKILGTGPLVEAMRT